MADEKAAIDAHLHVCRLARDLLLEVGAIQCCAVHPDVFFHGSGNLNGALRAAEMQLKAGVLPLPPGFGCRDFVRILEDVYGAHRRITFCYTCDAAFC